MAKVVCQKCGKLLSNYSENRVEHFLVGVWISHFHEKKYNEVVAKSNREEKERIKEYPEDGDDIDTWFDVNMEFADDVWMCPKCKTMHIFDMKTRRLKDIYWRLPVDEWEVEDIENVKHFYKWIDTKKNIHNKGKIPTVKEGEVWWGGIGENIGIEINGKSSRFSRPVLIMRKLSREGLMGVPLTSQEKSGKWYVEIEFLGEKQYAAICQARVYSANRLYDKMGTLPESDLQAVREGFLRLYR